MQGGSDRPMATLGFRSLLRPNYHLCWGMTPTPECLNPVY